MSINENKKETTKFKEELSLLNGLVDWRVPSILHWICFESGNFTKEYDEIPKFVCEADDSKVLECIKRSHVPYRDVLTVGLDNVFNNFNTLDFNICMKCLRTESLLCYSDELSIADAQYKLFVKKMICSLDTQLPSIFIPKITLLSTANDLKKTIESKGWGEVDRVLLKKRSCDRNPNHSNDSCTQFAFVAMKRWSAGFHAMNARRSLLLNQSVSLIEEEGNTVVCRKMNSSDNKPLEERRALINGLYLPDDLY